uniref:Carboxylic ester hydrolase n=1 Tax=Calliphora stygia TaxID=145453 RepID=A0A068FBT4_CALSG|nr:esterase [Calliphora stygia]
MSFNIPIAEQMRIALSYVKFKTKQKRLRTDEKVIVDTTYGKIKGVKWRSLYGPTTYYSFEGIPFAKPPLGELRFKAPVEPVPWTGVKRCTRVRAKPCQYNIIMKQVQGREDCLYLNVYTKKLKPSRPMPVLVWVYGGGFQMGEASRDLYSPDYIMMENVVLVTIAYRLGPLGFLSLGDEGCDIPGNAGLKDQVLALKWVKKNCHFFGGDSENITVFGESAGAASTHYLTLTEQTKGLFHKAVAMSGCAMEPWAMIPHLDWAYRLAKVTGYKGENKDTDVLEYLKQLKLSVMFKACDDLLTKDERQHSRLNFSFGPCVEPYKTEHCVIDREPLEMLRNNWGNNIPLLIGGNSFEGLLAFSEVRKYPYLLNEIGEGECLPPQDANLTPEKRLEYGRMIKQVYFGDQPSSWETILQYSDLISYKFFWHGIHRTLLSRRQYATAPTYLYRFDFDSKHFNLMRIITCGRKVRGTCHADDLSYLFYNAGAKKLKYRTAEYTTIRRMVAILVKFAECGDPNIPLTDAVCWPSLNGCISKGTHKQKQHLQQSPTHTEIDTVQCEKQQHDDAIANNDGDDVPSVQGNDDDDGVHSTDDDNDEDDDVYADADDGIVSDCVNNDGNTNLLLQQDEQQQHHHQQQQHQYWPPITCCDDTTTFKCLNISDELEVIDLPEAEKLKLWDAMYEDKSLLY